ncbi:MAG: PAS domain S-box protein [Desulfobacterium sp.]|nr:PAS domain S-box protein [Desulfobacterium sp.]
MAQRLNMKKGRSLRTDFILALCLTTVIALAITLFFNYFFVYSKNMAALQKSSETKVAKAVETLKQPLWLYDVSFVNIYAEILATDSSLVHVSIYDERDRPLATITNQARAEPDRDITWRLERTIQLKNRQVGRLVMEFTNADIRTLTRKMMLSNTIIMLIILLSVLAITWMLMTRQILSPLKIMEKNFHRISAGDYSRRAPLEKNNELTRISEEFNTMVRQVQLREEKIRESEVKYRNLVESSSDIIFKTDIGGDLVFINSNFSQWTGFDPKEFIGKPFSILFSKESPSMDPTAFMQNPVPGNPTLWELALVKNQGGTIPIELSISVQLDLNNHPLGTTGIARDITERKTLESKLQQSQKMEAIGTFAGGIAHDFNNIIGGILGYAEMIEMFDARENDKLKSKIDHVLKGTHRARDLIEQILTFSRHSDQKKRPLNLGPLIKDGLKFLRASIPSTIKIKEGISGHPCAVWANETAIHQILMNLCSNAADAMKASGGTLTVALAEERPAKASMVADKDPGHGVTLTVSDTGEGIDAGIRERIFDPFFTTKGTGDGTGMGLSVVHGIVKELNGTITVNSDPGKGSSFKVTLPGLDHGIADEKESAPPAMVTTGKGKILFIDDEEELVSFSRELLEQTGYQVVGTTSSVHARHLFLKDPMAFDLVVTDQTMPNITGFDLAMEFLETCPDIPIVLCTGFSMPDLEKQALAAGIRAFAKKPLGARRLIDLVEQMM